MPGTPGKIMEQSRNHHSKSVAPFTKGTINHTSGQFLLPVTKQPS